VVRTVVAVTAAVLAFAACSSARPDPRPSRGAARAPAATPPNPSDFVRIVDNPWYPLKPGTVYRWTGVSAGKPAVDVLRVTHATKAILGVRTTVIHDRVFVEGRLEESTSDWFAQDRHGTVWYFGEATRQLDRQGHVVSTAGSWQAGVNGARQGIFMPAHPRVGQTFRQEFYKGHAEDRFTILSLHATVKVPFTSSSRAMRTRETTPLEPGVVDEKIYVRGIGTALERTVKGGEKERLELVSVTHG
jgi:hypothetical protein